MTEESSRAAFPSRAFATMVRAELVAMGRPDVTIDRNWFDEDEPGYPLLVHVPVGTELTIPLQPMDGFSRAVAGKDDTRHAREFAKALTNLKSAERMLTKYARDIRRAANAVVAGARAEGLDILLDRVGFKPTYARHLTSKSWKEAAFHILAEVVVRHTSFFLRPTTSQVWVEEPADVAKEMQDILEDQRQRQEHLAKLETRECDLVVDQITLDLLAAHGVDAAEVLKRVWKEQCVNLAVEHLDQQLSLSLIGWGGKVTASILLRDAVWNGEYMWLTGDQDLADHSGLVGKALGDLVRHSVFSSRPIAEVLPGRAHHIVFDLSDKVLFDADTGNLWREERLAA